VDLVTLKPMTELLRLSVFINLMCGTVILFSGCFEQELPINPHPPGLTTSSAVNLGADYAQRIYFDLPTATAVASHDKLAWDLAFSSETTSPTVRINSSRFCHLARTAQSDFSAFFSEKALSDLSWAFDAEEGPQMHTAAAPQGELLIGELLILDLGYDLNNSALGLMRLMIDSVTAAAYHIRFAPIDQPALVEVASVPFDGDRLWLHFSLQAASPIALEPPSAQWQLLYTQYTALLDGATSYLVTGILTPNPELQVCDLGHLPLDVALDANWDTLQWSSQWNAIGYDWKAYDFDLGAYSVDANRLFAIRTPDQREFLLQFVDFYSPTGTAGFITFTAVER
jgi:hypothetical protein